MLKRAMKKVLGSLGYEVLRIQPQDDRNPVLAVCEGLDLPVVESIDPASYRAACPPLCPQPVDLPAHFNFTHYRQLGDALSNISMQQYFEVRKQSDGLAITDDYPGSHYYSRQRMLCTAYQHVFGRTLKGVTVLDIGCSSGYYSFHCARLGASRVLGFDARPEHEDQFRLLQDVLRIGPKCSYRNLDMEKEMDHMDETFDLVLAQGVLYHVYDQPRFVRNLYRLTGRAVVVEGYCSGRSDHMCLASLEETENLRMSIHGPVLAPSLAWMVEMLRWAGFRDLCYILLPPGVADAWEFGKLKRAMILALK